MPFNEIPIPLVCFILWLALLGASLGSFLDCAVSRWAAGDPHPFGGRSRCDACGHTLGAVDLVPVFSFLLHRGKCRYCGAKIPADCLAAELAGAAALVCVWVCFGFTLELVEWAVWAMLLLALSLTDRFKRVIPNQLLLALVVNRVVWFFILGEGGLMVVGHLMACIVPAAVLLLTLVWEKCTGREVMGGGDIKLLFVLALYLGWMEMVLTLLVGCLLALVWALLRGLLTNMKNEIRFGPFLSVGALLTVCFGWPLIAWYLRLF